MTLSINLRLEAACDAVAAACCVTRLVQQSLGATGAITKDDRSPVTVADFAAQAVVQHRLAIATLGDDSPLRIVGEESAGVLRQDDQSAIRARVVDAAAGVWDAADASGVLDAIDACNHDGTGGSYWTLDPVDGTKGFLRGGQYAISLAWIENGEVMLGVMGCPNLSDDFFRDFNDPDPGGLIYYATRGDGAWELPATDMNAMPKRIALETGSASELLRVCESVEAAHSKHDDTAKIVQRLGGAGAPVRLDSQCKYAVVARGQADAYLRMPTRPGYVERIWDHAAGMLVAEEAGATVTDVDGHPLDFSRGAGLEANCGVICATPAFHGRILDAIRELDLVQTC